MKNQLTTALRTAALAAALLAAPAAVFANEPATADSASQQLALKGSVPVQAAGPFVQVGTFQIQVSTKLGAPSARLPDGTWLYHHRNIAGTDAEGTLVVRFAAGRVRELALVTPAVATAMLAPPKAADRILVANNK